MIHASTAGGPSMSTILSGFFNSTVTVLRATSAADAAGEVIPSWDALVDHIDLPALVAGGDVSVRLKKQETRTTQITFKSDYRRILMAGSYDRVTQSDRIRVADKDWAIISITTDVTNTFTEFLCESIEPGDI